MSTLKTIRWAVLGVLVLLSTGVTRASQDQSSIPSQDSQTLKDDHDKKSYAVGMNLGTAIRQQAADRPGDFDVTLIIQGFKDALAGGNTLLTDAEMRVMLNAVQAELKGKHALRLSEQAAKAKSAGEAFLAENKVKEGVVTLPSGLQYKVLKPGEGKTPTVNDVVVSHYRGTLIDGKEFDSTYQGAKPASFAVAKVIKGWSEALKLMPVGSTWRLFIPPHLAYGERGAGSRIGPNETLIFDVELISIHGTDSDVAAGNAGAGHETPASDTAATDLPASIIVAFKMDPRITKALYMGDRWVSAPFTQRGDEKQVIVEAKADVVGAAGKRLNKPVQWIPADSTIATAVVGQSGEVTITVLRPGQTNLRLIAEMVSTEFTLQAEHSKGALEVSLAQKK